MAVALEIKHEVEIDPLLHVLAAQVNPSNPYGQEHLKEFSMFVQVPPFKQGLLEHCS